MSPIPARISARRRSIETRPLAAPECQNAQPLQASSPCANAPMRWIEPTESPSEMAPSARTSALTLRWRRAGARRCNQPALDQRRERHPRRVARV